MNPDLYDLTRTVVRATMETLTLDECKEYALTNGLFNRNTKLLKGDNFNVGLELLPADISGKKSLCAGAGECKFTCLAFSGVGNVLTYKRIYDGKLPAPLLAKCKRTKLFLEDRKFFEDLLNIELQTFRRVADLKKVKLAIRMNVTSDVDWSDFINGNPDIQFYSYSKIFNRAEQPNHHITYSASEKTSKNQICKLIAKGKNVAMIFKKVPSEWNGIEVMNGDENDDRYNDKSGVIIGLKYKTSMGKNPVAPSVVF